MDYVLVSPEMTTVFGSCAAAPLPDDPVTFHFTGDIVQVEPADVGATDLRLIVVRAAILRLFDWDADKLAGQAFHLSYDLRRIAADLRACTREGDALQTYRLAKSIELLCELVPALMQEALVPAAPAPLAAADTARVIAARRIIDERWTERLTIDGLARAAGLNRAKLTRGFRALYRCTVAEALAERRLGEACSKLATTDLPVSTIGYQSGYLNNAAFARAFGRRFGQSPSAYRAGRLAA